MFPMHTNVLPVPRAASPLSESCRRQDSRLLPGRAAQPLVPIPVPKSSAQRTKLLLETLRWVQENARCVDTRRHVSRVLRVCEGKK
jgi:hypothetical protein